MKEKKILKAIRQKPLYSKALGREVKRCEVVLCEDLETGEVYVEKGQCRLGDYELLKKKIAKRGRLNFNVYGDNEDEDTGG